MIGQQQAILIIPHLLLLFLNWSSVSEANPSSETGPLLVSFVLAFGLHSRLQLLPDLHFLLLLFLRLEGRTVHGKESPDEH